VARKKELLYLEKSLKGRINYLTRKRRAIADVS